MTGPLVPLASGIFLFIAGGPSGRGITFWAILLYCSPIVLLMAAVAVIIGAPAKRRLLRRQITAEEVLPWRVLMPSLIFDALAITGSLILTVYALEEWLEVGSSYHGNGWVVLFLLGTALLSSLITMTAHILLLSKDFGEHWPAISFLKKLLLAFQLGLVNPGAFAVVAGGLVLVLS